jgi:Choline dehydrogenase and related flavoproteins
LRSKVVKNVLIQNSDAVSLPFLKQSTMSINRISHPLIFSNTEIEGKLLFSQIYFYSDNLLKIFFGSKLINNAANISPLILKNLFGGLRIFIDPTISSKIKLKYSNGNISSEFISQDKKLVNRVLSRYFKSLRRSGIYPINFLKKELLYGESYHFGSQFSHSKTLDINNSNINGNVNGLKRTFVVDSSVLPSVNTGPITYTVMANSLRISEAFLKSINN